MERKAVLKYMVGLVYLLCILVFQQPASGQTFQQVHDPSDPVFYNGRWYICTTGDGIYTMSKISLTPTTGWKTEKAIFPDSDPEWIKNYVPGFDGNYWAPHLTADRIYYSCSTFGSKVSAIGLAEGHPGGTYADKGMVIYSNTSTSQGNAIDPYVFDKYLIYGSWFDGIFMVELGQDGKPATTTRVKVVDGGSRNAEAAFMTSHNGYYYLWFNRGNCCKGTGSTYYVQVGRSASITGPFLDRNNTLLTSGGGTTVLSSSDRFIGPGGTSVTGDMLVWHFYDGQENGAPRLMTGIVSYIDGWPCVTPSYGNGGQHCNYTQPQISEVISGETYRITPAPALTKCLDVASGGSTNGVKVRQWEWQNTTYQQFKFIYRDSEQWLISPLHATDKVLGIADSSATTGAKITIQSMKSGEPYQSWQLFQTATNCFRIKGSFSEKCLTIENASPDNGASLVQQDCNESSASQQFYILPPQIQPSSSELSYTKVLPGQHLTLSPNPVHSGRFTVSAAGMEGKTRVRLLSLNGKVLEQTEVQNGQQFSIETNLISGIYLIQLQNSQAKISGKLVIR